MEMNEINTLRLLLALAGRFGLGLAGGGALFFRHGDDLEWIQVN